MLCYFYPRALVRTLQHHFGGEVVAKGVTSFHSFVWRQFSLDKYEILQPIRIGSAL